MFCVFNLTGMQIKKVNLPYKIVYQFMKVLIFCDFFKVTYASHLSTFL